MSKKVGWNHPRSGFPQVSGAFLLEYKMQTERELSVTEAAKDFVKDPNKSARYVAAVKCKVESVMAALNKRVKKI